MRSVTTGVRGEEREAGRQDAPRRGDPRRPRARMRWTRWRSGGRPRRCAAATSRRALRRRRHRAGRGGETVVTGKTGRTRTGTRSDSDSAALGVDESDESDESASAAVAAARRGRARLARRGGGSSGEARRDEARTAEMEESQTSESVAVLPDMSEPLTSETEEAAALTSEHEAHPVAVTASVTTVPGVSGVSGVGVPVSLPVGSIIGVANSTNGTTFNVITSEQLQLPGSGQFKQMLCVDNGFICEPRHDKDSDPLRWNGELKATHIVIQNSTDETESEQIHVPTPNSQPMYSWSESANLGVLPIRCKNTNAELHKSRFGSGGRGRCIKFGTEWYTPSEFEALCGRASSKDWKRSIRFGGRSLQTLIDEQILKPHATSCTCAACCDDDSATGPVRLFTPYKRRKRPKDSSDGEVPSRKHKVENSRDGSNNDESGDEVVVPDKEVWPQFVSADGLVVQQAQEQDTVVQSAHQSENCQADDVFKKLDEMSSKMTKLAYEFKRILEEAKEMNRQQRRDQALVAQLGGRADVIETVGLQPASDSHNKKCANCNREAFAECSLCRRTPYCSTFCQRKDWGSHQIECVRGAAETVMLIVESGNGDTSALPTTATDQ